MNAIDIFVRAAWAAALIAASAQAQPPQTDDRFASVKGVYLDRENHPAEDGVRFDIQLERPDGTRGEVPVTHNFHSGDRIWLRMDVRKTAFVYVLNRTGDELPHLVFGPEKVKSGASRLAPQKAAMRFDDQPGSEKLYVIVSPKPLKLESLFDREGRLITNEEHPGAAKDLDREMALWSGNSDSVFPDSEGSKGIAADDNGYCVARKPNETLMLEINLRHSR